MLTRNQIGEIIRNNRSQIMTIEFIRKTDGKFRRMNCRLNVKKHLKGGKSTNKGPNRIVVFDMHKQAYRTVIAERVISVTINGKTYKNANPVSE